MHVWITIKVVFLLAKPHEWTLTSIFANEILSFHEWVKVSFYQQCSVLIGCIICTDFSSEANKPTEINKLLSIKQTIAVWCWSEDMSAHCKQTEKTSVNFESLLIHISNMYAVYSTRRYSDFRLLVKWSRFQIHR